MQFDTIIVGAGPAGSVLANRLSSQPRRQVLLLEAGPDMPHGKIPEKFLDSYPSASYIDAAYVWNALKVTTDVDVPGSAAGSAKKLKMYEQARVVGGGSTINGQLANRGSPADFDEWQARGASGWSWADVLPYFRKLEHDLDFDGPLHGKSGRVPVRRIFPDLWPAHAKAVAAALQASGMRYLEDQNGECVDGYFPISISNAYERRVSASTAYLDPVTRQRKNLTILTDTTVTGLLFEGSRCIGVEARTTEGVRQFLATEVIVSCGAIHSPALLLRAGIGPAAASQALGIPVRADRPGVGQKLMDHPSVALASFIRPEARINHFTRRHILVGWRYSSGIGSEPNDMYAVSASRTAWHAVGAQIGALLLTVNKTFSETGSVRLRTPDWQSEPEVQFRLLSDARDLERMADGFVRMAALQARPELAAVTSDAFPAVFGERMRQMKDNTAVNRTITSLAARLLDGPPALRRLIFKRFVTDALTLSDVLESRDTLNQFIKDAVVGVWHASSSCRMGAPDDRMAVTDPQGRVYGVSGLRVVDASIFPVVPRAALTLTVVMAAEKIADDICKAAVVASFDRATA